jgi:uncharacterized small protein (DUF1192 family)
MEDSGVLRGFDWEEAEDITVLSKGELRERLQALTEEERAVSYRRRVLQGRIDLLRAELAGRGLAALAPEDLASVLLGNSPEEQG